MNAAPPSLPIGVILRAEQVAIFVTGVVLWLANGGAPLLLIPALFVPDLSMVGYLRGPRLGSITYNAVHHLVLALALLGLGWWLGIGWLILAGAVVLGHVGMDRALGYGLKLPTDFRDTHLGRIGKG
jgi:Domain of unknown function (DUF4260)